MASSSFMYQQVQEQLRLAHWDTIQSICLNLVLQPNGERFNPDDTPIHEFEHLLVDNHKIMLARYTDKALPLIMQYPDAEQEFNKELERLYREGGILAKQARAIVDQLEREQQTQRNRGSWIKRVLFGGGAVSEAIGETVEQAVTMVGDALKEHKHQKARMKLDTFECAQNLIRTAMERTTIWAKQRSILAGTIAEATKLAATEVSSREQDIVMNTLADDLPPHYQVELARVLADEGLEHVHSKGIQILSEVIVEAAASGQAITAKQLYERIIASIKPTIELSALTLQEMTEKRASGLGEDPAQTWEILLNYFSETLLPGTPAVALSKAVEREGLFYLYQVMPAGQAPVLTGNNQEVRTASFISDSPATRLGLVHAITNFPLEVVLPLKELDPALTKAAEAANPFIIPQLAKQYAPKAPQPPENHDGQGEAKTPKPSSENLDQGIQIIDTPEGLGNGLNRQVV